MTIPPFLFVLDIVGTVLLGLGLAKVLAGVDLLPAAWRFEQYGGVFIGVGAALMLPLVAHLFRRAMRNPSARQR